jgi:hypothetical protein
VQGRFLERHAAIHIRLAGAQFGIEHERAVKRSVVNPHGDIRTGRAGKHMNLAAGIDHLERAHAHE